MWNNGNENKKWDNGIIRIRMIWGSFIQPRAWRWVAAVRRIIWTRTNDIKNKDGPAGRCHEGKDRELLQGGTLISLYCAIVWHCLPHIAALFIERVLSSILFDEIRWLLPMQSRDLWIILKAAISAFKVYSCKFSAIFLNCQIGIPIRIELFLVFRFYNFCSEWVGKLRSTYFFLVLVLVQIIFIDNE